jgi:hypothetical protein
MYLFDDLRPDRYEIMRWHRSDLNAPILSSSMTMPKSVSIRRAARRASIEVMITADDLIDRVMRILKRDLSSGMVFDSIRSPPSCTRTDTHTGGVPSTGDGAPVAFVSMVPSIEIEDRRYADLRPSATKRARRLARNLQPSDLNFNVDAAELSRVFTQAWQSLSANQLLYSDADRLEMMESFTAWLATAVATERLMSCNVSSVPEGAASGVKFGDFADWFVAAYQRMCTYRLLKFYAGAIRQPGETMAEDDTESARSVNAMRWGSAISSTNVGVIMSESNSGAEQALLYDEVYSQEELQWEQQGVSTPLRMSRTDRSQQCSIHESTNDSSIIRQQIFFSSSLRALRGEDPLPSWYNDYNGKKDKKDEVKTTS